MTSNTREDNVDKELLKAIEIGITKEERADILTLEKFAYMFSQYRIGLKLTQADVGAALGKLYGNDVSQATISRFEALNLTYKTMTKMRQQLAEWIKKMQETQLNNKIDPLFNELLNNIPAGNILPATKDHFLPRRKRTHIDNVKRDLLEAYYSASNKPPVKKLQEIADLLDLDRDIVRVWFCNKRQKIRKEQTEKLPDELLISLKV